MGRINERKRERERNKKHTSLFIDPLSSAFILTHEVAVEDSEG